MKCADHRLPPDHGIDMNPIQHLPRRGFLRRLLGAGGLLAVGHAAPAATRDKDLFGEATHKVVYQFNKADPDYMQSVIFSIGEMLRLHGDNIHLVVTAFGPGIHILARAPKRPVPDLLRQRVASLAEYNVEFHACGNTLKSLHWTRKDLVDFATIVDVGANDLMRLQEQGYSYISW